MKHKYQTDTQNNHYKLSKGWMYITYNHFWSDVFAYCGFPHVGQQFVSKGRIQIFSWRGYCHILRTGLELCTEKQLRLWGDHVMHFLNLDWNTSILYRIYITCAMKYAHYNPWCLFWILFLFTFKDGLSINFLVWLSHFVCIHIFWSEKSNLRTCSYVNLKPICTIDSSLCVNTHRCWVSLC